MKLYRFIARYAGQRVKLDVSGANDDEAKNNFINKLKKGEGVWCEELSYSRSNAFVTYEEVNDAAESGIVNS